MISAGARDRAVDMRIRGPRHAMENSREQIAKAQFGGIEAGPTPAAPGFGRRGLEGAGVPFDPGNEAAAAHEETTDYFAAGVVGVGDEQHGLGQLQAGDHEQEFIQECALVAVTKDQALVNAGAQGKGMMEAADAAEEGEGLTGVAHDKGRLGVGLSGLVKEFDRGHLPAGFSLLDAVGQDDEPAVAALDAGMNLQDEASP